ncbi:MAG: BMC domain-containing protein [Candidatus Latescibacteria bacterium]|nr:BMC domain-containing protein [Candidatus Latescibacterota bacterium]MBT4140806.1 BMC domain-containing protein [Candidatus Latescibacterota bacterium]MBT5829280.1 BMC domain-containing protein [Candidatus Latescibacterota bacterium]
MNSALGLIEMMGFVGVAEAADAAVKAAAVELSAVEKIDGGLISIRLQGDVGAVQAAVEAGCQAAQQVGTLVASHVIPNPHEDLVKILNLNGGHTLKPSENLEDLSVHRLRQIARETPGLSIQGREISRANREQLLNELNRAKNDSE